MSKLEELIQQYCPDGVEYYPLNEVFEMRNGYTPSTSNQEFWDNGDIPWFKMEDLRAQGKILSSSLMHITPKAVKGKGLFNANSIIVATSATIGEHALVLVEHLSNQRFTNLYPYKDFESKVNMFFMNYYFDIVDEWCKSHINQSSFASVDMEQFRNLSIPVPPLLVQEEIVRILDSFTELQAELQAELQKRLQQYNYYRDNLLSFEGRTNVEWKKLGDICNVYIGGEVPTESIKGETPQGDMIYPIWGNGKEIYGYASTYQIEQDAVCISSIGANTGAVFFHKACFTPIIRLKVLVPIDSKQVSVRYLFHALTVIGFDVKKSSVPNMNSNEVKQKMVPIPSLAEQQRIVDILDRFDSLTNDLTQGLPAEIEKRKQQYEYYRDKLLTFKRLNA